MNAHQIHRLEIPNLRPTTSQSQPPMLLRLRCATQRPWRRLSDRKRCSGERIHALDRGRGDVPAIGSNAQRSRGASAPIAVRERTC
jgi:hypothetical protein